MTKELMIPENITPAIFTDEKKGIAELLASVKTKVVAFKGDISTEEGRIATKAFGKLINRSKNAVDDMGKEHVAKLKELPKQIDAQRKLFRDGMDEYKDTVLSPLAAWQETEDKRVEKLVAGITTIIQAGELSTRDWQLLSLGELTKMFNDVGQQLCLEWEEFAERATECATEARKKIETAMKSRAEQDKIDAELEALRKDKAERDKRDYEQKLKDDAVKAAALETERKAQQDKERIANEIKLAEVAKEQALAELAASKQKVIDDAQNAAAAKIEATKQAEADKEAALLCERERVATEEKAKADAQAKLEANKKHTSKIHEQIADALETLSTKYSSPEIVETIASGDIPHLSINY